MKKIKIKPHPDISRQEFVWHLRALWLLNDLQLNAWNNVKRVMERGSFYQQEYKGLIETILGLIRSNSANHIWKDFRGSELEEEIFAYTGRIQDKMEEIFSKVMECFLKLKNRFLIWNFTDYGPGDIRWINADDGPVKVRIIAARFNGGISVGEDGEAVNEFNMVINVVAINRDGQEYGEPFWVRDEHIAKHRKDITNN